MDDHGEQIAVRLISEGARHAVGHGKRPLQMRSLKVSVGEGTADTIDSDLIQTAILIITLHSSCDLSYIIR